MVIVSSPLVAAVGAGPAGLYAAKEMADAGFQVALINRDIKPGGLAEYGIFHNKHKMKNGLRKQFRAILAHENIHYYGNLPVQKESPLTLNTLIDLGFSAVIVAVGAQGTKWLGLPGEENQGVYHAKDLVYHYNQLPPFSEYNYPLGKNVVLIGAGNVMIDIAHYCIRDRKVGTVTAVVRRGPADIKFTKKEIAHVLANLDLPAFNQEIDRCSEMLVAVKQDPEAAKDFILSGLERADPKISDSKLEFHFLASPKTILGENGKVRALEVEETELRLKDNGQTRALGTGKMKEIPADTIIFCIGDQVDSKLGLPLDKWNEFAKHPQPLFPQNEISFEAYEPSSDSRVERIFMAGWAREASSGLVGTARKDGIYCAKAVQEFLESQSNSVPAEQVLEQFNDVLQTIPHAIVHKEDWKKLDDYEQTQAEERGIESFKLSSNEEMLEIMGLLTKVI